MAAKKSITILCGPNGSVRSARIDRRLQESDGRARLLVPSVAQARMRRERYFAAEGCVGAWGAPVLSLTDFAEALVAQEGVAVTRFDSSFQQRLLMEHCLRDIAVDLPETSLVRIRQTPGLIRHLVSVVNDLKQAAIEPEEFKARLTKTEYTASLDEGVAAVYELYQETMQGAGLYDVPGLYWHADYFAQTARPKILDGVTTLLWDGFDDFTPSEFRLLKSLAAHVETMQVGLNLDLAPDRQDRYALSHATLRLLRDHFDCQVVECEAPEVRSYVDFAAQRIFWREEPTLPDGVDANLHIVPCSDSRHEVESVAREVKKLLVEGAVAPTDVAVVSWTMSRVGPMIRDVLASFGVPCQLATERPLAESSLGRLLRNLFTATDWEREAIVELLHAPFLAAVIGPVPEATANYARRAQILDRYPNWVNRINRLREQLERGEREDARTYLNRHPRAVADLEALVNAMDRLHTLQKDLPASATQYDYALHLDGLVSKMVLPADDTRLAEEDGPVREGIQLLLELLADAPGSDMVTMSREEFLERFTLGLEESTYRVAGSPGGVSCLDASQVRNQAFAHVFVIGLNEGQVPAPPSSNAVYPERDRERLQEAQIPIEGNEEHHARQRMLFGHVLECARESITLSWQLTQSSGREASPSPFLTDVRELFPESLAVVAPYPKADSFLPSPELMASPRDVANRALYDRPDIAEAFPDHCAASRAGAEVEQERHSAAPFGPFDGVLSAADLVATIAGDYGEAHEFSVNQLEGYLSCPFRFYVDRILRLEDTEAPDSTVGPLIRGSILHDVLQAFHEGFPGLHIRQIGLGKADEVIEALLTEAFSKYDWDECAAPKGARIAEAHYLLTRLRRYLRVEHGLEEEVAWKPSHFEVAFGRAAGETTTPPSTSTPFTMAGRSGPVKFTGRVDRIDRDGDQVRLIDYKSGGAPGSGEITSGNSIQLSVYAEAVEQLLIPESQCTEARYLVVGTSDRREALGLDQKRYNWPNRVENMHTAIDNAIAGIRSGAFPPERSGPSCYGCGHVRACRHENARIERKQGGAISETEEGA